jgi:hypothetical protein
MYDIKDCEKLRHLVSMFRSMAASDNDTDEYILCAIREIYE